MRIDHALKNGKKLVINHLGKLLSIIFEIINKANQVDLEKITGISTKTALITSLKSFYEKNNDAGKTLFGLY